MSIYSISSLATVIICTSMGLFVLLKGKGAPRIQFCYILMQLSVAWWAGAIVMQDHAPTAEIALFWCKINHVGSGFIPCSFYIFTISFFDLGRHKRKHIIAVLLFWLLFSYLNTTDLFIPSVSARKNVVRFFNDPGELYFLFSLYFFTISAATAKLVLRHFRNLSEQAQKQILYILIGSIFGLIGGGTTFLVVYKIYVPYVVNIAIFSVTTFNVFFTYAIYRHHLMDIEVIVKKTVVFSGILGFVYIVFSLVTVLVGSIIPGGRHWSLFLSLVIITLAYDLLRNLLTNVTNKFLFQKKVDYRTFLRNFSSTLITIVDVERIANLVVQTLCDVYNLVGVSILLYDKTKPAYVVTASVEHAISDIQLAPGNPLVRFFSETSKMLIISNYKKENIPPTLCKELNTLQAEIAIPLVFKNKLIGILNLGKKKSDQEFTAEEEDTFVMLESQISVALNNAILFKAQKEAHVLLAQKNKMDAIIALSSGINHEINNPLSIISMRCQNILRKFSSGKFLTPDEFITRSQEVIESCLRNANRAHLITKRLANFAKPMQEELEMEPLNVKESIQECVILIGKKQFVGDNITITIEIPNTLNDIYADKIHFQQVLYNMIMNAYHAMEKNGTITFCAYEKNAAKIMLEIHDTGCGIPPENLEKIWEPFFTTKPTNPLPGKKATGSGLGLALVKRYIENSGGSIDVKSVLGEGTTFYLALLQAQKTDHEKNTSD